LSLNAPELMESTSKHFAHQRSLLNHADMICVKKQA